MALEKIVVVGGSLAGFRAAEAIRQQGFEGTLHFVGAEAREPYDRPPLSKEVLRGSWEPEKATLVRDDNFSQLEMRNLMWLLLRLADGTRLDHILYLGLGHS